MKKEEPIQKTTKPLSEKDEKQYQVFLQELGLKQKENE